MQTEVLNAQGGVIYAILGQTGKVDIISCSFIGCQAQNYGGAIYVSLTSGGKLRITESCIFTNCKAINSSTSGGAIYASITGENSQLTFEDSITFEKCSGRYGGGMYLRISNLGKFIMTGYCIFKDCSCSYEGGGCYIYCTSLNYDIQLQGNMQFEGCQSEHIGGGLHFWSPFAGQITINNMSFSNCNSTWQGGGFYSIIDSGVQMTITGKISFDKCLNTLYDGGGQYLQASGSYFKINNTGELEYNQCNAKSGGGIFCSIRDNAVIEINNASFRKCSSSGNGGGLWVEIESGGQLILDKACEFYQCESYENGGGIYVRIYYLQQHSIYIKDAFIHECKSLNNTNSSQIFSRSGFGGGMFLIYYGDYDPSTELINLRGMKIYNNSADKYGQSLYVVMPQVAELCQYGILGEYVKGNYSDTYSNESDLYGVPMNLTTFNTSTQTQLIQQQQQPLELWWRILGILKNAQVIVNISSPIGKLIFHLEGQRMIPKYLNVKIFELRNKTQEEIDQEQKEMNYQYNKNNLKSLKSTFPQSPISLKHLSDNKQQISINSNLTIKKKQFHNYENEIIYPPEDGSNAPISIKGEIESEQKATFEMNDGSWLNYQQKVYGVLISNDRNIFTGKDGIDIEEDGNAAVLLEVIIEEDDVDDESQIDDPQKQDDPFKEDPEKEDPEKVEDDEDKQLEGKSLSIGIIVGIAVGALVIVAVIIIIIIVAVFISKKKKSKKSVYSYGPEMRARELPMEIQYPQNSHSLDAINKEMESNNW
ncbi:MAG: hypothetical protein EZS28_009874 [Streblomastix strix]|uniref:Right handed beta helix domain-containing protein n=1 Tax=Streblomastix strix TaxID=222440 RepID=A0A5J4WIB0_9EUKA|nr:MAG: hypothetical protein EZS28_009874 [Streblomastix strix]